MLLRYVCQIAFNKALKVMQTGSKPNGELKQSCVVSFLCLHQFSIKERFA